MNFAEIISKIKEGDALAFKKLYEQYAPKFKGIAFRYVGNENEANDLIQEAFVKVYKSINSYKGDGNFEGWMKRILVNSCLNYIKREKKYAFDFDATLIEQPSTKWDSAISEMSFEEIVAVINQLPVGYKTVFNLAVFDGYSHKEIGEMIGITESASRSQLSKAKNKLKEELKKLNILSSIA